MGDMTADTTAMPSSTAVQPSTPPALPTTSSALHTTTSVPHTTTSATPTTTSAPHTTTSTTHTTAFVPPTSTSVLPSSASALPQSASIQHSPAITPPLYTTPINGNTARVVDRMVSVRASLAARWKTGWMVAEGLQLDAILDDTLAEHAWGHKLLESVDHGVEHALPDVVGPDV